MLVLASLLPRGLTTFLSDRYEYAWAEGPPGSAQAPPVEARDIAAQYGAGYEDGRRDALRSVAAAFVRPVRGQWPDDAVDPTCPKDWENWRILLHGKEAGDVLDGKEGAAHFLGLFGCDDKEAV